MDGKKIKKAEYTGELVSDGVSFTAYPISVEITYSNGELLIKGYKNCSEITYFSGIEGRFNGRFGIGSVFHGYMYFDDIKANASEIYGPYADYNSSTKMLEVYGRTEASVTLMINKKADNSPLYFMQHTPDETGEYSFTLRAPENLEDYVIYVRCGDDLNEITPYIN